MRWEERGSQRRENSARNHSITFTPGPHTHSCRDNGSWGTAPYLHLTCQRCKEEGCHGLAAVLTRLSESHSSFPKTIWTKKVPVLHDSQKPAILFLGEEALPRKESRKIFQKATFSTSSFTSGEESWSQGNWAHCLVTISVLVGSRPVPNSQDQGAETTPARGASSGAQNIPQVEGRTWA